MATQDELDEIKAVTKAIQEKTTAIHAQKGASDALIKSLDETLAKDKSLSTAQIRQARDHKAALLSLQEANSKLLQQKQQLEVRAKTKTAKQAEDEKIVAKLKVQTAIGATAKSLGRLTGSKLNKDLASTTKSLKNVLIAGIALGGMKAVTSAVGAYYSKYIMPIDAANQKIAASFGNLTEGAGKVSFSGMAASTTGMRKEVLALKTGLDGVAAEDGSGALQFLPPGIKGAEKAIELMGATTEKLGTRLDALVKPFDKSRRSVMILQQAIGATDEDTQTFADRAIIMGTTIEVQMATAAKASKKMAKGFGVNTKTLSKNVHILRKDFAGFATFSEEQLAKTAAAAQKLGISMAGISKLNVFDDFDKTADAAAQLGQSFGINVDAFELFQEQDPTERLRMLQEAAQEAGVDVSQMGRIGLKHFSELTGGMDVDEVLKSFSPGNIMRAQEGLSDAALKPAETLQQQQSTMLKLGGEMAEQGKLFFQRYVSLIPLAITDFTAKTQAITDSFKAGGDLPDTIRKTLAAPLANFLGEFAGQLGDPKNRAAIEKGILEVLSPLGKAVTALSGSTGAIGRALRAKSDLEKAKTTGASDSEIEKLAGLWKKAEIEANKSLGSSLNKAGIALIDGADSILSKAADLTSAATTAAGGDTAVDKGGKMVSDLAKAITGPLGTELNTFFTGMMPKLMKSIRKALKLPEEDFAINDAMIGSSAPPTLSGPVTSMQLASGMSVSPDPKDAFIAGRPGDIVSKYMDIVATALHQVREVNSTPQMQASSNFGGMSIARPAIDGLVNTNKQMSATLDTYIKASDANLYEARKSVNADQEIHVTLNNHIDIGNGEITIAALNGSYTPGGPSLRNALTNANSNGNDVGTA